jgi:MFS family permease
VASPPRALRGIPAGIWALGLVSLFMDMSSELVHSLLPVFLVSVLGASALTLGLIEGVAEATAAITKVFSGAVSDYLGKRKLLLLIGYGLAALTKPVFALAPTVAWVFAARFVDRVGKGIRGAPRDALVADLTAPEQRGAAYGLRQSLDSVGALLGPLLAVALLALFQSDLRAVMQLAVVPALITVALLAIYVRDTGRRAEQAPPKPLRLSDSKLLPSRYWRVVLLGAVLTLARFSEAFLVLRAQELGLDLVYVPLVMIAMNVTYAGAAYPAGAAADRTSARTLLAAGLLLLIAADLVLAWATSPAIAFAGAALWGLHMAFTQGLLAKLIAECLLPRRERYLVVASSLISMRLQFRAAHGTRVTLPCLGRAQTARTFRSLPELRSSAVCSNSFFAVVNSTFMRVHAR